MGVKVSEEANPLHPAGIRRGSRMTSRPAMLSSAKVRFASTTSCTAPGWG